MKFDAKTYFDVKRIRIAHEYTLDRVHKCEYPSGRGSYGLIYDLSGKALFRFSSGERVSMSEGDVLFLSPQTAYSVLTEKEFKHYTVNFELHEESSVIPLSDASFRLISRESTEGIRHRFKLIADTYRTKKAGYEMLSVGYLYELITELFFDGTQSDGRLERAREHIEQAFDKKLTLEELAFISNMSVTNFRREWKKHYRLSPLQYRDEIRLYCAKQYLTDGYYGTCEVAALCGFEDASYFVRFFKRKTGITPGEFKKRVFGKSK